MDKTEIYAEIRALLREPQAATTTNPWTYVDADLAPQVRSALRHLRVKGLTVTGVFDATGNFTTEATETEGMLISLFVAERLIVGDLMQKLNEGELGVIFKAGSDMIDTKQAATSFEKMASRYRTEFQTLLTIALASGADTTSGVFTETVVQGDVGVVE